MLHKNTTVADGVHITHAWEVANAAALAALSLTSTDIGKIAYQIDTTTFYILRNNTGPIWERVGGGREVLSAVRTYYVRTDGSDTNNGLANTAGGAFLTLQKAVDTVLALDTSIYAVTIQIADGTYTGGIVMSSPLSGAGSLTVQGNSGTPANVHINVSAAQAVLAEKGARITIKDCKLTSSSSYLLHATTGGNISFQNIVCGACTSAHLRASDTGTLTATGSYEIIGAAPVHFRNVAGITRVTSGITVTVTGSPAFSTAFAHAEIGGALITGGATYSGAATGARYSISTNAVIHTSGGGANYLPGNSAGSTATGGQYV